MTSYPAGGMVQNCPQGSEFYSHEQAKVLAQTYYDIGYKLYESIMPLEIHITYSLYHNKFVQEP